MKPPSDKPLPEQDPNLAAIVDAELMPYRSLLSPELLEHFRREALVMLSSHPYPVALLRQLSMEPQVKESGVLGSEEDEGDRDIASGDGGRRR